MIKPLVILFFFFFQYQCWAQTTIDGKLLATGGEKLAYASLTIEDPADSSIVAYTLSDSNGEFTVTFSTTLKTILIRMKKFNYDTEIIMVKNASQKVNFIAKPNVIQLKEINVKQPPIAKRNDTLNYNLNSFANSQDRTLGDVLKKIPGIDVSVNGQIRYQGRPINKFYVEGKDLMGGSYGVITNSLPNIDVTTVQVLQNHQPVKMLKDKVYSPDAAINIKLKKNITVTGRGELGIGLAPILWQTKLTPMLFNKKYQGLLSYKTNNVGDNIKNELNNLSSMNTSEGITIEKLTTTYSGLLSLAEAGLPNINEKRYLFNKTHTGSANILFNVSKNLELRSNISYINDNINRDGSEYNSVKQIDANGDFLNDIIYSRISQANLKNQSLKTLFSLTKNTETIFLKNNLLIRGSRNTDFGKLQLNSLPINQNLYSPNYALENSFSTILGISKNKVLSIQSFINYTNERQNYVVTPINNLSFQDTGFKNYVQLNQALETKKLNSINSVSTSFYLKGLNLTPKLEIELNQDKLNTNLTGTNINAIKSTIEQKYQNDLDYVSLIGKGILEINYTRDKLKVTSALPLKFNSIKADAPTNSFASKMDKLTFEPNIFVNYQISRVFKITTSGSIINRFSPIENLYPGYVFSNLDFKAFQSTIDQIRSKNISSNLIYEDVLANVFIRANHLFSTQENNIVINTKVLPNGQRILESLNKDNGSSNNTYILNVGKYFPSLKTNMGLSYSYRSSKNNAYLNQYSVPINNSAQIISFKINYNHLKWLGLDYNLVFANSEQKSLGNNLKSNNYSHELNFFVTPIQNHSLALLSEYTVYQFKSKNYKNPFLDIQYRYTIEKKKIDLEIKWVNILDRKTYEQIDVGEIQTTQTQFKIRPSQVLFSAKFNFR